MTTADDDRILRSTAVMASGTVVSRLSGFVRSTLLVAALGVSLHADIFTIANTIPNMLYILLAGGIFNAVLVPQLVRAMRNDPDGGEAYTNRVVTLAGMFLAIVTVLLVIAAPLVMSLMLDRKYGEPALAEQRQSAIDFARYCLPQVFFYGMFVLVGQILNSRRKFGPMMWAPIANNVISVGVLVVYLIAFGPATDAEQVGGFTTGQELLLGLGSTAGIIAQFLILVPYLRAAGYHYRPRFDFRNAGLGHTLRLGVWTVLFVIVNQVAYVVVVRLASGGTAGGGDGTGITIYSNAFLIVMVPHAIITVSLATAILPRMSAQAAESDLRRTGPVAGLDAARRPRGDRPVRGTAPGDRRRRVQRDLGPRRGRRVLRPLRADPVAVRRRTALLHRPLPGAARLLRARADPHGLLDPVRRRGHQHHGCRGGRRPHRRRGHLSGTGARLHRGVRRRLAGVVHRPPRSARRARDSRSWWGSWPGWRSSSRCRPRRPSQRRRRCTP